MQKQSASHFLRESNCKLNEIFAMKIVGGLFTQYVRTKGEGVLLDQVHKHTINIISIFYKTLAPICFTYGERPFNLRMVSFISLCASTDEAVSLS